MSRGITLPYLAPREYLENLPEWGDVSRGKHQRRKGTKGFRRSGKAEKMDVAGEIRGVKTTFCSRVLAVILLSFFITYPQGTSLGGVGLFALSKLVSCCCSSLSLGADLALFTPVYVTLVLKRIRNFTSVTYPHEIYLQLEQSV